MNKRLSKEELRRLYGQEYVNRFETLMSPKRLSRLIPLMTFREGDIVADFACGSGMMLENIKDRIHFYYGVDFSSEFIAAANVRKTRLDAKNAEFFCESIHTFCKRYHEKFDVGLALDFSEHVYDEEWLEIVKSIRTSLKPYGRLYLHTPNAEFFLEVMKARNFIVKQFPGHVAVRTAHENAEILWEAGFSSVKVTFLRHYNILSLLRPLSIFPVFGKYFRARLFIECRN